MKKIDSVVLKETKYIAFFALIFSLCLQSVFLIIGKWDYTVLLGNLLSFFAAVVNFLLMGITIQNAVKKEEKDAKTAMKVSSTYRNLFILVITVIGIVLKCFNTVSVIVPLFFPRIAIAIKPLVDKNKA
ncbi:MAG: hypothetical protein J6K88_00865 [Oscillospiraceae bacterium]|nr:hypothetical protein [Oscillospiraceae bacterium]